MSKLAPTREQKTFSFQTKEFDDAQGIVRGYLSTFDNVDAGGDRVRKGAFKRTLTNKYQYKQQHNTAYLFPLLWQHDTNQPIGGYLEAKEDNTGLFVELQVDLDVQRGKEAYSALKKGYIFQQSIGYETLQAEYVKVDGQTVRDLTEIRLWEGSIVTLPMNEEAVVTSVKSTDPDLDSKAASGKTSWPLMDIGTEWTGSKAEKQIFAWAKNDDGEIQASKAKQCFLWYDPDNSDKQSGYKMPFCYIDGGSPKIVPLGVRACANVLNGGMGGGNFGGDDGAMKAKVKTMIGRINSQFNPDPKWEAPWEKSDDGKRSTRAMDKKDFNDNYRPRQIRDWKSQLYSLVSSLCDSCEDAFKIGDEPLSDIMDALNGNDDSPGFIAELQKWIQEGIDLDYSNYLDEMQNSPGSSYGSGYYGYMADDRERFFKAMLEGDATTGGFATKVGDDGGPEIIEKVNTLKNAATKAMKAIQTHVESLHNAADEVTTLIGGSNQKVPSDPKRALPYRFKEGRTFSGANAQALSDHADSLHDMADSHLKAMSRSMKKITTVADDLATILQGSEPTYGSEPGTPDDGNQEGKNARRTPYLRTRTTLPRPSQEDTVPEDEIAAALANFKALSKPINV